MKRAILLKPDAPAGRTWKSYISTSVARFHKVVAAVRAHAACTFPLKKRGKHRIGDQKPPRRQLDPPALFTQQPFSQQSSYMREFLCQADREPLGKGRGHEAVKLTKMEKNKLTQRLRAGQSFLKILGISTSERFLHIGFGILFITPASAPVGLAGK